jgi:tetratricopeptide (TPR) repeat protein
MAPRRTSLASLAVVLLVPALALAPLVASGAGKKKTESTAPSHEYAAACSAGNAKYTARDFDAAIAQYRKAIDIAPHLPLAHYLLGEALIASGNLPEAEASLGRAAVEAGEKDPSLHAKVLFVTADLKERQKKWDDAKAAWQTYLDWANRFPDANVFPATAQSRLVVLDVVTKQDKAYEVVRQRIAASQDGGVFSDPSKSPPSK